LTGACETQKRGRLKNIKSLLDRDIKGRFCKILGRDFV